MKLYESIKNNLKESEKGDNNWEDALKSGKVINVYDKSKQYAPAKFFVYDDKLYYNADDDISYGKWFEHPQSNTERIIKHIKKLLKDKEADYAVDILDEKPDTLYKNDKELTPIKLNGDTEESGGEISKEPDMERAKESVKKWYTQRFYWDELGQEIPESLTFNDISNALDNHKDVYELLAPADDSIVRERVFSELADIMGVNYDDIYNKWLDESEKAQRKINESEMGNEYIVYCMEQTGPGSYRSKEVERVYSAEQAEDRCAELRAQGFNARYETVSNGSDDYEYDDGDTNWAAEEAADADERFENRYMGGGNGYNIYESNLKESQTQEIKKTINDLKKKNPNIDKYLNEYYKSIEGKEPRPAYDKEKDKMSPKWEKWNKEKNNVLYSEKAWNNFTKWVKEKYNEDIITESEDEEDFYCEWCGTKFKDKVKDDRLPNCPHCYEDRYKDDPEKDTNANKDVHKKGEDPRRYATIKQSNSLSEAEKRNKHWTYFN